MGAANKLSMNLRNEMAPMELGKPFSMLTPRAFRPWTRCTGANNTNFNFECAFICLLRTLWDT